MTVGYYEYCENCINGFFNYEKHLFFYQLKQNINVSQAKTEFMKSAINTKNLVLNAIKDKLESENISKLLLVFNLHTDIYSAHVKPVDSTKSIKFKMNQKETSMIKKMFVSKIRHKIENVNEYKDLIISVEIEKDEFGIFLNDNQNVVTKFEM